MRQNAGLWTQHVSSINTTPTAYRFGHQKVVLTNVLLKMGILVLETCRANKPAFCRI
jgi:hypothetical protein